MTTTVVTATTAAITAGDVGFGLGLVMVLTLIGLLVQREFSGVMSTKPVALSRTLGVVIVPLLVTFGVIVVGRLLTAS
jgi:hypothetical protein